MSYEEPERLSIYRYLQTLMDKGLSCGVIEGAPDWQIVIDPDSLERSRALAVRSDDLVLGENTGHGGLVTITDNEKVRSAQNDLINLPVNWLDISDFDPPSGIEVINVNSSQRGVTEQDLFDRVFSEPASRIQINDRYLYDQYRLVERVGAYIKLAQVHDLLEEVDIYTWDAGRNIIKAASRDEQNRAIQKLQATFPAVKISVHRPQYVDHDRYLIITRTDGSQARILIGKGLDFIHRDGTVEDTYVVIEDPFISRS